MSACCWVWFIFKILITCYLCAFCPRRPHTGTIRCLSAGQVHRSLTSPPSSWPGRELRKYHYPRWLSSPGPSAERSSPYKFCRSPFRGHGAPTEAARVSPHRGNVSDGWLFSFQEAVGQNLSFYFPIAEFFRVLGHCYQNLIITLRPFLSRYVTSQIPFG